MEAMSTVDMGFRLVDMRRLATEMRWLDRDDCDERADTMDAEGEVERGVDASELGVLYEYDAIGTIACEAEEEGEEGAGEQRVKDADDSSNGGRRGRGGHVWRTVVGVWVFFSGPAVLRSLL